MNLRVTLSIVALCLALSLSASAANVSVNCSNPQTGVFPSINAALNSLDPSVPNVITVHGTCKENIFLFYFQRLTIQAVAGQTAVIEYKLADAKRIPLGELLEQALDALEKGSSSGESG